VYNSVDHPPTQPATHSYTAWTQTEAVASLHAYNLPSCATTDHTHTDHPPTPCHPVPLQTTHTQTTHPHLAILCHYRPADSQYSVGLYKIICEAKCEMITTRCTQTDYFPIYLRLQTFQQGNDTIHVEESKYKHTHTQPFSGPSSGTTRKTSPTHIHPDHQTSCINFVLLLRYIASSVALGQVSLPCNILPHAQQL